MDVFSTAFPSVVPISPYPVMPFMFMIGICCVVLSLNHQRTDEVEKTATTNAPNTHYIEMCE